MASQAQDPIRVPGYVHGWGSIIFKIDDTRINGYGKVGYGDKRTHGKGYGGGRHHAPTHRSPGKYDPDPFTTELYKETAQAVREALAAKALDGNSYGNVIVQIEVLFTEPGAADLQVTAHDACITADKADHSEGPDGLMDALEWDIMFLDRDGKTLFDGTEGSP